MIVRVKTIAETSSAMLIKGVGIDEQWVPKSHCWHKNINRCEVQISSWLAKKIGAKRQDTIDNILIKEKTIGDKFSIETKKNQKHQNLAINKLHDLKVFCLFMQTRAGKTKVAIDIMCNHYNNGVIDNVVWLCPLSVIDTVERQWDKFRTLNFKVTFIGLETISSCSIERFERDTLCINERTGIICDESQMIKNHQAIRSKRILPLFNKSAVKGLLSGTPITKNIDDIYFQMLCLDWRILRYKSFYSFQANHLKMSNKIPGLVLDSFNVDYIKKRIDPFMFSWFHDYSSVKKEKNVEIKMSDEQKQLYEKIKQKIIKRLESFEDSSVDIYLLFSGLCSVMSGYVSARLMQSIFKDDSDEVYLNSPKIDALKSMLKKEKEKTIIWCNRKSDLHSIVNQFPESRYISGDICYQERNKIINDFKKGKFKFLVSMIHVAKRGINLSCCNNAIYYSHSFDYEAREQSIARLLLPSKTDCSIYTNLIFSDGLDGRIFDANKKKQNIISQFFKKLKENRQEAILEAKNL